MNAPDSRGGFWRSKWAAIGAAVAVTLGAGGLIAVDAASSPESSVVTVTPARILDTRVNLGLVGPFERGVSRKVQVTGSIPTATGVQTVVPAGATGVLLNVTVVCNNRPGVTCAGGWLAVRPGDVSTQTTTSSLNFVTGDVVPNSVQVGMPSKGNIDVVYGPYAPGAQVDVVIDVVGYMSTQLLGDIIWALPFVVSARDDTETLVPPDWSTVVSATLTAPMDGQVTVNTSTTATTATAGDGVRCWINNIDDADYKYMQEWASSGTEGNRGVLAGTRVFNVKGGQNYTFRLLCSPFGTDAPKILTDSVITAMFTPPY